MKRVRCPKCDNYILFDETKYTEGQSLVFECNECGKQFGIRIGVSKLRNLQRDENPDESVEGTQVIPLQMGDNVIGRYMKDARVNCPIETVDPSIDITHCVINVSRDKHGKLKYILRDGPSYTGTFVDNVILGDRERRVIENGTLFTIGATSIILKTPDGKDA